MSLYPTPCVLFAGGKSSRMGEDKAFLPFGRHESLIEYQVERLKDIFAHVYVSAKDAKKFKDVDTLVIEDLVHNQVSAPTVGFLNIFRQLKAENSFFVLSVDTPFVDKFIINKLLEADNENYDAIIVRTPSGTHPLCGIYTRGLEVKMEEMVEKGEHKLMHLLERSNVCYIDVDNEHLLSNLNTPQEYQKALKTSKS